MVRHLCYLALQLLQGQEIAVLNKFFVAGTCQQFRKSTRRHLTRGYPGDLYISRLGLFAGPVLAYKDLYEA